VVEGVVVVVAVVVGVVVEDEPGAALAIAAPPPAMRPAAPSVTRAMRNRFKPPSPPLVSFTVSLQ
jgi:hypothetical protein